MPDPLTRTLRNFRLVEQIGTGGMGLIYRAIQLTLDRPVALKELHPHLAKDRDFVQRFEREAKMAATLEHENIVRVIDFGREGDSYFLALEFVDGSDLRKLLDKTPRFPLPVAITVLEDVLRGLACAHANGVVHRDVKPANVLVTKTGTAKLADFSIAQAATMPSMTATGAMLGSPAYMSPEQASGSRSLDARTDLFSAGVILYEMLSGSQPFDGDSYPAVLGLVMNFSPPDLSEIDPLFPAAIARVVHKALEKDPDRRYQTAAEFLRDLETVARDEKIPTGRELVAEFLKNPSSFARALPLTVQKTVEVTGPVPAKQPSRVETTGFGRLQPGSRRIAVLGGWALGAIAIVVLAMMGMRGADARHVIGRAESMRKAKGAAEALEWVDKQIERKPWLERSLERTRNRLDVETELREYRVKYGSSNSLTSKGWELNRANVDEDPEIAWILGRTFEDMNIISAISIEFYGEAMDRGLHPKDPHVLQLSIEEMSRYPPDDDSGYMPDVHEVLRKHYDPERVTWARKALETGSGIEVLNAAAILEEKGDPAVANPWLMTLRAYLRGEAMEAYEKALREETDEQRLKRTIDAIHAILDDGRPPEVAVPAMKAFEKELVERTGYKPRD